MAAAPLPHTALSVFIDDESSSQLIIQPRSAVLPEPGSQVDTLSINLDIGKLQVTAAPPHTGAPKEEALAVLGLCKLHAGNALIVATAARPVAQLNGADIYELVSAKVLASAAASANRANRGLLRLLRDAVDPAGSGRGLHFSYGYDLSCSQQNTANAEKASPEWAEQLPVQRADARFFWNRAMAQPLVNAGAARFVQPLVLGFVQQLPDLALTDATTGKSLVGELTLIARRAVARAGTRQWRRGADTKGAVANFVETEQILTVWESGRSALRGVASFTVVRASIPLLWTQLPNIKYKPTTVIAPAEVSSPAFDQHITAMVQRYRKVVAINLVNQHGTEGKLEAAFRAEAQRLNESGTEVGKALRYVAFDFHAECSNKRYHRLSLLWDKVAPDFKQHRFLAFKPSAEQDGRLQAVSQQSGVMRVNCIDCLDRTNVVQGVIARKALEAVLQEFGALAAGGNLPQAYPEVERQFKILWADHGDAVSTQYAGTGAMKSGFTRTGKRTLGGVIDDGVKAVTRYYLNNFQDGAKQDAIDLVTGAYTCDTIHVPPLKPQPSPLVPLVISMVALCLAAYNFGALFSAAPPGALGTSPSSGAAHPNGLLGSARHLLGVAVYSPPVSSAAGAGGVGGGISRNPAAASVSEAGQGGVPTVGALVGGLVGYVALPLAFGLGLLLLVVKNGKHLVNKPQLCPQLATTVQKPGKAADAKKRA